MPAPAPTQAQLIAIVHQRYPALDLADQTKIANAALLVLSEVHWVRLKVTPLAAVKIAYSRVKHRKSF